MSIDCSVVLYCSRRRYFGSAAKLFFTYSRHVASRRRFVYVRRPLLPVTMLPRHHTWLACRTSSGTVSKTVPNSLGTVSLAVRVPNIWEIYPFVLSTVTDDQYTPACTTVLLLTPLTSKQNIGRFSSAEPIRWTQFSDWPSKSNGNLPVKCFI